MPKANSLTLDQRIGQIVSMAARQIADVIRADVAAQVVAIIRGGGSASSGRNGHAARSAPSTSGKRTYPPHCLYPNCTRPHKGPRWSFLCENHLSISKAEKRRLQEAYKQNGVGKASGRGRTKKAESARKAA